MDKELLTKAVTGQKRAGRQYPDLVVSLKTNAQPSEPALVHLESQTHHRKDMGLRMFRYYTALRSQYNAFTIPIVIYLRTGVDATEGEYREGFYEEEYLSLRYHIVSLPHLSGEKYLAMGEPLAAALSTWMRSLEEDTVERKLQAARVVLRSDLNSDLKSELLNLLDAGIVMGEAENTAFVQHLNAEFTEEAKAMQYVSAWERDGLRRGREEGLVEGRVEGRVEGQVEGERTILLRQLVRKFGTLPPETLERIESETDLVQLEEWSLSLLDAKSLEEVGF